MWVSNYFLRLGALSALVGMTLGVWMGANQDFTLRSVHAHINLLGFASMMIFGLFYRSFPHIARSRLAAGHFILSVIGFLILMPSIGLMLLEKSFSPPLLIVSEIMLILSMLIFTTVVFMATGKKAATASA